MQPNFKGKQGFNTKSYLISLIRFFVSDSLFIFEKKLKIYEDASKPIKPEIKILKTKNKVNEFFIVTFFCTSSTISSILICSF